MRRKRAARGVVRCGSSASFLNHSSGRSGEKDMDVSRGSQRKFYSYSTVITNKEKLMIRSVRNVVLPKCIIFY